MAGFVGQGEWDGTPLYTIKGDDVDGYYWHVSRAGRPGDQSDTFPTYAECLQDCLREHPDAKEAPAGW